VQGGGSIAITNTGAMTGSGMLNNSGALNIELGGRLISHSGGIDNAGSLVNDGGLRTYKGTISNTGTLTNNYALTNSYGSLTNHTGVTLTNQGNVDNQALGSLVNSGTFNIESTGGVYNRSAASIENSGTLNNQTYSGTVYTEGMLTNEGTLDNVATVEIDTPGSIEGAGSFTQTSGAPKVNGLLQQPVIDIQGGDLLGEGTILGSIILGSAAKLNPGFGFGKLTVDGGIVFNGSLLVDIAGIAADNYDLLDAYGGEVNFGAGSLIAINLDSLFAPEGGMAWDLLLSDNPFLGLNNAKYQVNGLNSSMDYMIREVERGGHHALEFTVPEPGSLALFGQMMRRRSSQAI